MAGGGDRKVSAGDRVLDAVIGTVATVACVLLVAGARVDSWWTLHHPPRPKRADRRDLVRRLLDR